MPTLEEIQASIDSISVSNDSIDFVTLATQASAETGFLSYCSVKTVDMLPSLFSGEIPDGQVVYVDEIGGPVLSSGKKWMSLSQKRIIRNDGSEQATFAWGESGSGQHGSGILCVTLFTPTNTNNNFCQTSKSRRNSSAINESGCIFTAGCNDQGQLGQGLSSGVLPCQPVFCLWSDGSLRGTWCKTASGFYNTYGITTSGRLYGVGWNGYGLGGNTGASTINPTELTWAGGNCTWRSVFAGRSNVFLIKTDGTAWGAGENGQGILGVGDVCNFNNCIRQLCGGGTWCMIAPQVNWTTGVKTDGTLLTWGRSYYQNLGLGCGNGTSVCFPTQIIGGGTNWCKVRAGEHFGAGLKTDGTIWTWGYNTSFALGIGNNDGCCYSSPITIAGGRTDWCDLGDSYYGFNAITSDGRLWGWGANSFGQIGDGTNSGRCSPVTALGGNLWKSLPESSDNDTYHNLANRFI